MLRTNFFSVEEMIALLKDFRNAGLPDEEVAIMALARKVTLFPGDVTDADLDELRSHGLSDGEILDVILAAAGRNFFSKTLDALHVEPDEAYDKDLEPELLRALTEAAMQA